MDVKESLIKCSTEPLGPVKRLKFARRKGLALHNACLIDERQYYNDDPDNRNTKSVTPATAINTEKALTNTTSRLKCRAIITAG